MNRRSCVDPVRDAVVRCDRPIAPAGKMGERDAMVNLKRRDQKVKPCSLQ